MNSRKTNLRIISGGQSGVERAALDFALCNGLNCSGWCPMGRIADDGLIPIRYPLHEAFSDDLISRVLQNVIESDGVLIIISEEMDVNSQLTHDLAKDHQKPAFVWMTSKNANYGAVRQWIENEKIEVINITGHSERFVSGIHEETLNLIGRIFPDLLT